MKCEEVKESLEAFLDKEITSDERKEIETHLATCEKCREELRILTFTQNGLRQALGARVVGVEPSPQVWDWVRQRIESRNALWEKVGSIMARPAWRAAVPIALVLVVAFGALWGTGIIPGLFGAKQASTPTTVPVPTIPTVPRPPGPAPSPLVEFGRIPDITSVYGENVEINLSFTNEASEPRIMSPYPPEIKIIELPNIKPPDTVVYSFHVEAQERTLQAGETATYSLTWDQRDDSGKQVAPGWYGIEVAVSSKAQSEDGIGSVRGLAGKIFIPPPQGVMQKTIEPNESQTATGLPFTFGRQEKTIDVTITLQQVQLTSDSVGFTVLVTSPDYVAPQAPGLAHPQWMLSAYAQYTIDNITKDAGVAGMRPLENGLQLFWGFAPENLDPVPSDTRSLTFVITKLGDWEGPWEFRIPLE